MAERIPASLLAALTDLVNWLDATQTPSMIIGGVAASVLGRPRLTQDVDALAILPESAWTGLLAAAALHGIAARIAAPLEFARRTRVMLLRHTSSGIDIDLIFGGLAFELAAVGQSEIHELGGMRVRLPRVVDLLIMKAIAHRPKDMLDIEGLLAMHPEADVAAVLQQVREFAAATSMSDVVEDFERLLTRRTPDR